MKFFPNKKNREDGITLILTVIMVSGIAVITSTVAFFVVQEIRNARSSRLAEPAIVAAESAGEQGLFLIKQGASVPACGSSVQYTEPDGSSGPSDTLILKCISTQPATFTFTNSNPVTFFLYDPNDVNGNTCMEDDAVCPSDGNGTGNQLFTQVIIDYVNGTNSLDVKIDTLDGVTYLPSATILPGNTGTYIIDRNIVGSNDERLMVTLTPSATTSNPSTVDVSTAGLYTGLPDYQTIDASGCRSSTNNITNCDTASDEVFKRRINITLPR